MPTARAQATLTRQTDSDILAGYSLSQFTVSRRYELNRDFITAISNRWAGSSISSFEYSTDAAGRRSRRVDTLATTNTFAYNARHELQAALMGTNRYGFSYDPIGNRITYTEHAVTSGYVWILPPTQPD